MTKTLKLERELEKVACKFGATRKEVFHAAVELLVRELTGNIKGHRIRITASRLEAVSLLSRVLMDMHDHTLARNWKELSLGLKQDV